VQQDDPLCVCDLTTQFEQRQPTISHHLRILREAGLIVGEKRGTWSYYAATEAGRRSVSIVRDLL
jgi:ArsR family transcriptional regulator